MLTSRSPILTHSSDYNPMYHGYLAVETELSQPASREDIHTLFREASIVSVVLLVIMGGLIVFFMSLRHWKNVTSASAHAHGESINPNKLNLQLPCANCHYFKSSYYLPCAVNPMIVLKPESLDCHDFKPREAAQAEPTSTATQ